MFKLGDATILRVEETNVPSYKLRDVFTEMTDAQFAEHGHWLAPHHYEAKSGCIRLAVHSWLLKVGGKTILIDSCCGNNKVKPRRPFWHMLNEPYLERLAAAVAIQSAAAKADYERHYRGAIIIPTGRDGMCWTIILDNHTGRLSDGAYGKCQPDEPQTAAEEPLEQARLRSLGNAFRR